MTGSSRYPKVSVVLPTYNDLRYLPGAVASVLGQSFADFELIVVDDGSTDDTPAYLATLSDPRVRAVRQENRRLPGALNAGFALARGEYLTWTSSDNLCEPGFLGALAGALDACPDAGFACSAFTWIDEEGNPTGVTRDQDVRFRTLMGRNPGIASFMYRRACRDRVGDYDPALEGAEDWDYWLRILEGTSAVHVPRSLYRYRRHARTMTETIPDRIRRACEATVRKTFGRLGGAIDLDRLYPEIRRCADPGTARLHACLDFGAMVLSSPFWPADVACAALSSASAGVPASGGAGCNLAVALARAGRRAEAVRVLSGVRADEAPGAQEVAEALQRAFADPRTDALHGAPLHLPDRDASELLRREDGLRRILDPDAAAGRAPRSPGGGRPFRCSIVIPVYNCLDYTRRCLESIAANTGDEIAYEVVLVDNASTDGTAHFLSTLSGDVTVLTNDRNEGFARACNQGARAARGEYIVFLNNDTEARPGWLSALVGAAGETGAGICGAKLLYPDGTVQHAGVAFGGEPVQPYHIFRGQEGDVAAVKRRRFYRAVTAACMLVRADLFRELDGFDEGYRNGFEDVDLCLRALERGSRILYEPACVLVHHESKTPGRKRHESENARRFMERWSARMHADDGPVYDEEGLIPVTLPNGKVYVIGVEDGERSGFGPAPGKRKWSDREKALMRKAVLDRWHALQGQAAAKEGEGDPASPRDVQMTTEGEATVSMRRGECGGKCGTTAGPGPDEGRTTRLPGSVHFLLNDACNARCVMCGADYYRSRTGRRIGLEAFRTMAANLGLERFRMAVLSGGGDPLLNPDLVEMVAFLNATYPSVEVHITTNGIGLTRELSERLLAYRIHSVNVSLNAATRETYERVMQVDCFDRVCANAADFARLRESAPHRTVLQFSMAAHRKNIEELPPMVELGRRIGIDSVNVMYCRFYPPRLRDMNILDERYRLRDEDSLVFHQELSDGTMMRAAALAARHGIRFQHEPLFRDNAPARRCVWPEAEIMVGYGGEVYPCGGAEVHFREKVEGGVYHFGNALRERLDDFWNGEAYRALRVSSRHEGKVLVPECECCANIMRTNDVRSHIMEWEEPPAAPPPVPSREPLVSVIVPTHDRPEMLAEAIGSILRQTFRDFEIVVVNDAGAGVEEVVARLNAAGNIAYVRHDRNRGLAAARNTGIRVARGRYVAYLDDDDTFLPDHLETLVACLKEGAHRVAYTDANRVVQREEGGRLVTVGRDRPYSEDFSADRFLAQNYVPVLCFMHEKSLLSEVGGFDESLTSHEDWDLWVRMSRRHPFRHIPRVTCEFTWRDDGSTMTSSRRDDFLRTMRIIHGRYRKHAEGRPEILKLQGLVAGSLREGFERDRGVAYPVRCSIVIPLFNRVDLTRKCIEALAANTGEDVPYEVILVDNGSTDGTQEFLASLSGDVTILTNAVNEGFARACNRGAAVARGKYVVFLNNDTEPQPGWLSILVRFAGTTGADICGSRLLYPDGTVQHAGVAFDERGLGYHVFRGMPGDAPAANRCTFFQAVTAACMLVRAETFRTLGGFDEAYRNGFEDVDFCLKAREGGYQVLYVPESVLVHHEESSPGRKDHDAANMSLFLSRWRGRVIPDDERLYADNGFRKTRSADGSGFVLVPAEAVPSGCECAEAQEETPVARGVRLKRAKRFEEAAEIFRQALAGGDAEVRPELADCLAQRGELEESDRLYRETLLANPGDVRAHVGLGVLALAGGNAAGSALHFHDALGRDPGNARALCGMGLARKAQGWPEDGFEWLKKALESDPENLTALHELTRTAFELGRTGEAEGYLRGYLMYQPSSAHILFSLAGVCFREGKREEAAEALDRLDLFHPGYDGAKELREKLREMA